jgi:hypothetical protein
LLCDFAAIIPRQVKVKSRSKQGSISASSWKRPSLNAHIVVIVYILSAIDRLLVNQCIYGCQALIQRGSPQSQKTSSMAPSAAKSIAASTTRIRSRLALYHARAYEARDRAALAA